MRTLLIPLIAAMIGQVSPDHLPEMTLTRNEMKSLQAGRVGRIRPRLLSGNGTSPYTRVVLGEGVAPTITYNLAPNTTVAPGQVIVIAVRIASRHGLKAASLTLFDGSVATYSRGQKTLSLSCAAPTTPGVIVTTATATDRQGTQTIETLPLCVSGETH